MKKDMTVAVSRAPAEQLSHLILPPDKCCENTKFRDTGGKNLENLY
jgi:hypothetical protein